MKYDQDDSKIHALHCIIQQALVVYINSQTVLCVMQPMNPLYPDYLLKHARESRRLSMQQVTTNTGIAKERYEEMESGCALISATDATLLGALLQINPGYIEAHNMQLQLLYAAKQIMQRDNKKIESFTRVLKRKITSKKTKSEIPNTKSEIRNKKPGIKI